MPLAKSAFNDDYGKSMACIMICHYIYILCRGRRAVALHIDVRKYNARALNLRKFSFHAYHRIMSGALVS